MKNHHLRSILCLLVCVLLLPWPAGGAVSSGGEDVAVLSETAARAGLEAEETVRAIVLLSGTPAARGGDAAQIARTRQKVLGAMEGRGIPYRLLFTYEQLLCGFAAEVPYGRLEELGELEGVERVYLSNTYDLPEGEAPGGPDAALFGKYDGNKNDSIKVTGSEDAILAGYDGAGLVIAVLDTGFFTGHEVYKVYPQMLGDMALSKARVEALIGDNSVSPGQYISDKFPFVYDYAGTNGSAGPDNDVTDVDGHGTSVAATAAGYAEDSGGNVKFSGSAPGAQILGMKVFYDEGGGATTDIYFAALEDAMVLGADVINMSFGVNSGMTYDRALEGVYGNIFQTLRDNGVVVCVAAGNSNSMKSDMPGKYVDVSFTDYGVLANPSSYAGNIAVAAQNPWGSLDGYSSWGCAPDLTIKPQLTSVGDVNSAGHNAKDSYVWTGGTSLASPNLAGAFLDVLTYLRLDKGGPQMTKKAAAAIAEQLMESTATPSLEEGDNKDNLLASVRKQGAGLGNPMKAIEAYRLGAWLEDPIQNLGHDPEETGVYTYETTLVNDTDFSVNYALGALVMTDKAQGKENTLTRQYLFDSMTGSGAPCENTASVTFAVDGQEADIVTVPARGRLTVEVTITLSEAGKTALRRDFPNGIYLEGYVRFTDKEDISPDLRSTYLAYFGDWGASPAVEPYDTRDYLVSDFADRDPYEDYPGLMTDFTRMEVREDSSPYFGYGTPVGDIPYSTNHTDAEGNRLVYSADRISMSSEKDAQSGVLAVLPYLRRGVEKLVLVATDKETGEEYGRSTAVTNWARAYNFSNGESPIWISDVPPLCWSAEGVPDGRVVRVELQVENCYPGSGTVVHQTALSMDVTIDNQAPTMKYAEYDAENKLLYLTLHDNRYLAAVNIVNGGGNYLDITHRFATEEPDVDVLAVFDTTGWPDGVGVYVADYAYNENGYGLALSQCDVAVSSVAVTGPAQVDAGYGAAFTATVLPADAARKQVVWTSGDERILTVSEEGVVTGVKPGTATVTATTVNGKTSSAEVTVLPQREAPISARFEASTMTLTGVSDLMEYSLDGGESWTALTGESTDLTGKALSPEKDIQVRLAQTQTRGPSLAQVIDLTQAQAPDAESFTTTAPSERSGVDGHITWAGTGNYEYRPEAGESPWKPLSKTTDLVPGDYLVRTPGAGTALPSPATPVTVPDFPAPGVRCLGYANGKLTVSLAYLPAARLLVAAYAGDRLVEAVPVLVKAGDTRAELTFRQTLSSSYTLRAFVLGVEGYCPVTEDIPLTFPTQA